MPAPKKPTKRYTVAIELEVGLVTNAMVVDHPDSVAAAVRQYLRFILPNNGTKTGVTFHTGMIHVEAREKEKEVMTDG